MAEGFGFNLDGLLLAEFARPKSSDIALDLCSGCGVIPASWLSAGGPETVCALDIQPEATELCRATAAKNGWTGRLSPVCADLREHGFACEGFSLVTANPPYFKPGCGRANASAPTLAARSESLCTLEDVAGAAAFALRFGGRFCLCHRPERLADALCCLRLAGLEPKRLALVSHTPGEKPWLLLAEGKKGGGPGLDISLLIDRDFRAGAGYTVEGGA